jgi:hypothetical protein
MIAFQAIIAKTTLQCCSFFLELDKVLTPSYFDQNTLILNCDR